MSQDGHRHNNNSAANAAELLSYVWPFWDIGNERKGVLNYMLLPIIIWRIFLVFFCNLILQIPTQSNNTKDKNPHVTVFSE